MTHGALRRGVCCGGVRGIGATGSGPRRCGIAREVAGQAARHLRRVPPNIPCRYSAALPRSFTLSVLVPRVLREIGQGGAEGALMELNGWASAQMLRRYGASARSARARRSYDRVMEDTP
jgi:hypothetical protein